MVTFYRPRLVQYTHCNFNTMHFFALAHIAYLFFRNNIDRRSLGLTSFNWLGIIFDLEV